MIVDKNKLLEALESAFRSGIVNAHLTHLQREHIWETHTLPRLKQRLGILEVEEYERVVQNHINAMLEFLGIDDKEAPSGNDG